VASIRTCTLHTGAQSGHPTCHTPHAAPRPGHQHESYRYPRGERRNRAAQAAGAFSDLAKRSHSPQKPMFTRHRPLARPAPRCDCRPPPPGPKCSCSGAVSRATALGCCHPHTIQSKYNSKLPFSTHLTANSSAIGLAYEDGSGPKAGHLMRAAHGPSLAAQHNHGPHLASQPTNFPPVITGFGRKSVSHSRSLHATAQMVYLLRI
jgi:hypothetical protein